MDFIKLIAYIEVKSQCERNEMKVKGARAAIHRGIKDTEDNKLTGLTLCCIARVL